LEEEVNSSFTRGNGVLFKEKGGKEGKSFHLHPSKGKKKKKQHPKINFQETYEVGRRGKDYFWKRKRKGGSHIPHALLGGWRKGGNSYILLLFLCIEREKKIIQKPGNS